MTRAIVLSMALGLAAVAHAQAAAQPRPQQREQPPPPPPPPGAEPAPEEAPPPEEPQQQQQPPPPPESNTPPPQPEENQQEELRRLHLAFGASGVAQLGKQGLAIGFSGEVGAKLVFTDLFNVRLFANYTYLEDTNGTDHFLLLSAEPTLSFGFYSAGIGVQLGIADLFDGGIGGVVGGFVAPLKLRFGSKITAEFSVDLGVQLITSNPDGGISPFGRLRFNIFL